MTGPIPLEHAPLEPSAAALAWGAAQGREEQFAMVREYLAAVRRWWLPEGLTKRREALGLPFGFEAGCGYLGEGGGGLLVVPVLDAALPLGGPLMAEFYFDHLLDLMMFYPAAPRGWHLRHGRAVILGGWALAAADHDADFEDAAPLQVYADPLAWLRDFGQGVVILDWDCAAPVLGHLGPFFVDDVSTAERLGQALKPEILVKRADG